MWRETKGCVEGDISVCICGVTWVGVWREEKG